MKTSITSILALTLIASPAFAGNFELGLGDPVVTPPAVALSWAGPYAGVLGRESRVRNTFDMARTEIIPGEVTTEEVLVKEGTPGTPEIPGTPGTPEIPAVTKIEKVKTGWECKKNHRSENIKTGCQLVPVYEERVVVIKEAIPGTPGTPGTPAVPGTDPVFKTVTTVGDPTTITVVDTLTETLTQESAGIFAGYRYDMGTYLLGAEVSLVEDFNSLEATLSLPMNRFLGYVSVGAAEYKGDTGWTAGIGVDYMVSQNLFIGTKFSYAEVGSYEIKNIDLRVGVKF